MALLYSPPWILIKDEPAFDSNPSHHDHDGFAGDLDEASAVTPIGLVARRYVCPDVRDIRFYASPVTRSALQVYRGPASFVLMAYRCIALLHM